MKRFVTGAAIVAGVALTGVSHAQDVIMGDHGMRLNQALFGLPTAKDDRLHRPVDFGNASNNWRPRLFIPFFTGSILTPNREQFAPPPPSFERGERPRKLAPSTDRWAPVGPRSGFGHAAKPGVVDY